MNQRLPWSLLLLGSRRFTGAAAVAVDSRLTAVAEKGQTMQGKGGSVEEFGEESTLVRVCEGSHELSRVDWFP